MHWSLEETCHFESLYICDLLIGFSLDTLMVMKQAKQFLFRVASFLHCLSIVTVQHSSKLTGINNENPQLTHPHPLKTIVNSRLGLHIAILAHSRHRLTFLIKLPLRPATNALAPAPKKHHVIRGRRPIGREGSPGNALDGPDLHLLRHHAPVGVVVVR